MVKQRKETEKFKAEEIHLNILRKGSKGVTSAIGESLAQAAAVCLEDQEHSPGTELRIDGDFSGVFFLLWDCVSNQIRRSLADMQEATEWGACGVAILLVEKLTSLRVVQRSYKGTGFDYWLGKEDDIEELFQGKKRLEASGILRGTEATIRARVKKKLMQTDQSDGIGLPALVVVVEFSAPRSRLVEK
jgi:hypothetical protein